MRKSLLLFITILFLFPAFCWGQTSLPTSFSGSGWTTSLPTGWSQSGMGTDYTTTYDDSGNAGKFDTQGDYLLIYFSGTSGTLTYILKGNSLVAPYQFDVQESSDGSSYTTLKSHTSSTNVINNSSATTFTVSPSTSSRYIKFIFITKTSGNVGIDGVSLTTSITDYYSNSTDNLNELSTWGSNTDGSGTNPSNFTTAGITYYIRNNTTPTLASAWTVSGSGSKVVVGNGTNACNFTIPSDYAFSGTVDVSAGATLTIQNTTIPTFGTLSSTSTIDYASSSSQTISAASYGNLTSSGSGSRTLTSSGTISVAGTFTPGTNSYTITSSTVQFNGSSAQTIPSFTYNNLTLNNNSGASVGSGGITVDGTLTLTTGTLTNSTNNVTLSNGATITITNTSTTTSSLAANPIFGSSSSDRINVTIANSSSSTLTSGYEIMPSGSGNIGTLTVSSGDYSLNSNASIDNLVIADGSSLKLAAKTLTINGTTINLNTSGNIYSTSSSSGNLVLNGQGNISTLRFHNTYNILKNFTVAIGSSNSVTLASSVNVTSSGGAFTLTSGKVVLGSYNLTANTISGGSSTAYVVTDGSGALIKSYSATGSTTFPIGDATSYTPVTINVTAGTFSSGTISANVTNSKYSANASTTNYLKRYWTLTSSGISGLTYNAEFTYVDGDINGTESSLYGGKCDGSTWTYLGAVNTTSNTFSASSLTSFSTFTAGELGAMPVELTDFDSDVDGNKVKLYWNTATEVNNYGFEVERAQYKSYTSTLGIPDLPKNWEKIGFVEGHGNSNSPKDYTFTDQPTGGKDFLYRLKQIDFDGAFEYSKIITASLENVNEFQLEQNYPNPFNPTTRISYKLASRASVRLKVYDLLAQVVAELVDDTQEAGRYEVTFDGSKLPSGTYFYKLEAGQYVEVRKLLLVK